MTIHQILSRYWGYSTFRSLQEDIINSVLSGQDTLALMPTGGGKSVCFQVPALARPGICIVVSPLIALMKDQVEDLKEKGIPAIAIISGMGKREIDILLDNCIYGDVKFLYISPERLLSDLVRERIRHMNVNLIAIDEAHCISQWGYDFRPPYLLLSELRSLHPQVPVLALTATATKRVIKDIQEKLLFKQENVFKKSFERENLSYSVLTIKSKYPKLIDVLKKVQGSGIVYVRNRRETQEVAKMLNRENISADFYHAGLDTPSRARKQTEWKKDKLRVIVATNAFGMGIDKSDVRVVVHLELPESLEAYYQEAGRAGRDEKKAFAVLLYSQSDKVQLQKKLEQSFLPIEEIKQLYHHLGNYFQLAYGAGEGLSFPFDIGDFCSRFKLTAVRVINGLKFLEKDQYIALGETVFLPSRVKISVSHEEIYRFQIEQPAYDSFIKTLLRSYGGIYDHFIPINENDLAKRNELTNAGVRDALDKLEVLGLLNYIPQTDKPFIQFLKPRCDTRDLLINRKYIAERMQIQQQQLDAVINYAETIKCRSQQLLNYFEEADTLDCGICDVCIENKRALKQKFVKDELIAEVLEQLAGRHLLLEELVPALKSGTEKQKLEIIRILLDAGKIKSNGQHYYI